MSGISNIPSFRNVFLDTVKAQTTTTKTSRGNVDASENVLRKHSLEPNKAPLQLRMAATAGEIIGTLLSPFKFNPQKCREDISKKMNELSIKTESQLGLPIEIKLSDNLSNSELKFIKSFLNEVKEYKKEDGKGFEKALSSYVKNFEKIAKPEEKDNGIVGLAENLKPIHQQRAEFLDSQLSIMFAGGDAPKAAKAQPKETPSNPRQVYEQFRQGGGELHDLNKVLANRALFNNMKEHNTKEFGQGDVFAYLEADLKLRENKNDRAALADFINKAREANIDGIDEKIQALEMNISTDTLDDIRNALTSGDGIWNDVAAKYSRQFQK